MNTLYNSYRRVKLGLGGTATEGDADNGVIGKAIGSVASMGAGILDGLDHGNEWGNQESGTTVAKGALNGAAAGTAIMPGIGTVVGGVIGAGVGLLTSGHQRHLEAGYRDQKILQNQQILDNRSAGRLAADPTLYQGYRGASYYAHGGPMIKPSHRGKFTDWAKSHGMTVAEATSHVLSHKGSYSGDVRKMAQFSRNFGGHAMGGPIESTSPIASMYMEGGKATPISADSVKFTGNSHDNGGIQIPDMKAEVEGGETMKGNFVYSKELGFADEHKKLAKMLALIEAKPQTQERLNALKRLGQREDELGQAQEAYKRVIGQGQSDQQVMADGGEIEDPTKKLPPAKLDEWNKFIDFVDSKGYKGNPTLDIKDKNLGQSLFTQYRASNPGAQLSYDDVLPIQQHLSAYRDWSIAQAKAGKVAMDPAAGANYENYMQGLSQPDGWFGSKTSSHKFPSEYIQSVTGDTRRLGYATASMNRMGGFTKMNLSSFKMLN